MDNKLSSKVTKKYSVIVVFSASCGACHYFRTNSYDKLKEAVSDYKEHVTIREFEVPNLSADGLKKVHPQIPELVKWFPYIMFIESKELKQKRMDPVVFKDVEPSKEGFNKWILGSISQKNPKVKNSVNEIIKDIEQLQLLNLRNS